MLNRALLALLCAVTIAILGCGQALAPSRVVAPTPTLTDAQYIDLIDADNMSFENVFVGQITCEGGVPPLTGITSPDCLAKIAASQTASRKFHDDVQNAQPPARLRAMHERLRRDLVALRSADEETGRVLATGDQAAFDKHGRLTYGPAVRKVMDDATQLVLCGRTRNPAYFQSRCTYP